MIITVPNQVLTTPAKKVEEIDKKILQIIALMKKSLLSADNPKGVGLAATQIGESYRIFITRPTTDSNIEVFINPEIIFYSKELSEIKRIEEEKGKLKDEKKLEGCLSIPNVWGYLKRSSRVRMKYMETNGNIIEKEFNGFMATIIQHETDHINGILFTQRVLEQDQKLYRIEKNKEGKEKLVEIEI